MRFECRFSSRVLKRGGGGGGGSGSYSVSCLVVSPREVMNSRARATKHPCNACCNVPVVKMKNALLRSF